ncbi:MAG: hypothetical protein ABI847_21610 [Anaerolineales bacterium]
MADIPLYDDMEDVPAAAARAEVRITELAIRPYADGRRMKLSFSLTPFLERPSIDVTVINPSGQEVASLSLIEAMDTHFDFTIHLRGPEPVGAHELRMQVFYLESDEPGAARQVVDERSLTFSPAEAAPSP